jgi:hypothetical protein
VENEAAALSGWNFAVSIVTGWVKIGWLAKKCLTANDEGFRMHGRARCAQKATYGAQNLLFVQNCLAIEEFMARDRNVTVWQAYVVVMSIVSFLCLGTLAFMMFTSGTNSKVAEAAQKDKREAETQLRSASSRNQLLESMLGIGKSISPAELTQLKSSITGDAEFDAAFKNYTDHMTLFGPSSSDRTYAKLVDTLMQELRSRNSQIAADAAKQLENNDRYEKSVALETKLRTDAQAKMEAINLEKETELANYTKKVDELEKKNQKIESEKQQKFQEFARERASLIAKIDQATKQNAEQARRLENLVAKLQEIQNENFQYIQGEITNVANGDVWLNIGAEQGLKPGVMFSVYDSDVSQVGQSKAKAKVEVVEIMKSSRNLSRAKIIDDKSYRPILTTDKVYSQFWQPHTPVRMGLVGKLDYDRDGRDDRELIKKMIRQNGAEVVFEVFPDGRTVGNIEDVTKLVIGEDIKIRAVQGEELNPEQVALAKKRKDLDNTAKSLGIPRENLDQLMNLLQATIDAAPTGEGTSIKASQYLPRAEPNDAGRVSNLYQNSDGRVKRTIPE